MMLALLGLLPVIILLYFLKLKRRDQLISSTYLWQRAIEDLRVNRPFQRLRRNLLLWLQLALLALLVLGLTRPAMNMKGRTGDRYICLIDTSASMGAQDVEPDRITAARREALQLVSNMSRDDQMLLMTFDAKPSVLVPFTSVKAELRNAIWEVRARETSTNFAQAMELVGALAKDIPRVKLLLLSDGGFDVKTLPEPPEIELTYVKFGVASENVGITAIDARRNIEDWGQPQVFCRVQNFGAMTAEVRLDLYLNEKLFAAQALAVPPGEAAAAVFSDPGLREGLVRVAIADEDDLAADNQAWLFLVEPRQARTLLVTSGNYFLEPAVQSDPLCSPVYMKPADFDAGMQRGTLMLDEYDMVIFDRHAPGSLPPGSYLFLGALPPMAEFGSEGEIENPVVIDWDTIHPINQYVSYGNLFLANAMRLVGPEDAHTLVETDGGPLILWWASATHRLLVVGFDIYASRWPLRPSFPVFMANAVRHLGGVQLAGEVAAVRPGGTIQFSAIGIEQVPVTYPHGSREPVAVESDRVGFGNTTTCGPYTFHLGDDEARTFVVNLADSRESNIAPRDEIPWREITVAGTVKALKENREIWPWLVLLALCVLMVEWYIYNRRVYL